MQLLMLILIIDYNEETQPLLIGVVACTRITQKLLLSARSDDIGLPH